MKPRLLFAGGGTGGHLYPAMALAKELTETGWEILFLGTRRETEARIFENAPYRRVALPVAALRRSVLGMAGFAEKMGRSLVRALWNTLTFRPDLCVGLGGYGSLPGVLAAKAAGVPIALFEPNSVPGKANRWLERLAAEIWVANEDGRAGFKDPDKAVVTGVPLRRALRPGAAPQSDPAHILVLGGSQGARGVNALVEKLLPRLGGEDLHFDHVAGPGNEDRVAEMYRTHGVRATVRGYVHAMENVYARARAVICRCGAGTLAEVTAFGLPAVLVPHPGSPDRHQHHNAGALARAGAGLILEEGAWEDRDLNEVVRVLSDEGVLARMASASRAQGEPQAHRNILKRVHGMADERMGK